ncbi:hypothetical protein MUN88_11730 [Gracilibacillus caseinilyticus]|uniref:Uncharacterized protein n=1 Tax=Gracilibacillus caseinilyticus TaxID=2932256 RepID=A0ABY4ESA2_9BACI|nr:hypothetical protein [Gracilibacillus caseinilyticus]UOQ46767.1 hypothetical protein MUN88_11730 [Gracilibacillus caseinilyticus]
MNKLNDNYQDIEKLIDDINKNHSEFLYSFLQFFHDTLITYDLAVRKKENMEENILLLMKQCYNVDLSYNYRMNIYCKLLNKKQNDPQLIQKYAICHIKEWIKKIDKKLEHISFCHKHTRTHLKEIITALKTNYVIEDDPKVYLAPPSQLCLFL